MKNNEFLSNKLIQLKKSSRVKIEGKIINIKPNHITLELILIEKDACFIATAVYGEYDAPQVLMLRKYLDTILLNSVLGKSFIHFYYFVSPLIAKLISKSDLLKYIIKYYFLEPIVIKLQR